MADMVASAVIQDGVSRAISFLFGNSEEQAPGLHSAERLEIAVSELEFVLERTSKLPITDLSLLRRRKIIKLAYANGTDLLNAHRGDRHGGEEEAVRTKQVVKRSKLWITRSEDSSASSASATLSTDAVRRFERFAELAGKFQRDVESGCSLRRYSFCNPLVRHLLEGKTLSYEEVVSRSALRRFYMWPVCVEGRGVETMLEYWYEDYRMAEKRFHLGLMLRVSESTDIVATAVKCLQSMASQFKVATETAAGELTLLANSLQCVSDSHHAPPPWADADQESHTKYSQSLRPDPVCCKDYCDNSNVSSSELSHMIPEQVILFSFGCCIISAHAQVSPLELIAVFAPHFAYKEDQPREGYALEKLGDSVERRYVGIQEVTETVRSKATVCFLNQAELTGYAVSWIARHGFAGFDVQKSIETGPRTSSRSRNRRNSKRMR